MALVFAMLLGADSIDDCEVLRAGRTRRLLGGWVPAPSTLGTFLRAFTFGHVRQLDKLLGDTLARAWRAGAGPGDGRLVIDVDSFVGEVCGRLKQGAAYGYTKVLGYHPILATRADTREMLHIRLRKGSANTQKGMLRFCEELIARIDRAGATRCEAAAGGLRVLVDQGVRAARAGGLGVLDRGPDDQADQGDRRPDPRDRLADDQDYPKDGEAQIAETTYGGRRLIVRRTRLLGRASRTVARLAPLRLLTNRTDELALVEAEHRDHAVVEQVIADLKDQALVHFPSGEFNANGAWTVIGALAHNLLDGPRIGLPDTPVRAARTLRRWLLHVPGRLTRHARGWTLHLPARWPWQGDYITSLARIRALPAA